MPLQNESEVVGEGVSNVGTSVPRRQFLKRSGAATAGTILAWHGSRVEAYAESSMEWTVSIEGDTAQENTLSTSGHATEQAAKDALDVPTSSYTTHPDFTADPSSRVTTDEIENYKPTRRVEMLDPDDGELEIDTEYDPVTETWSAELVIPEGRIKITLLEPK